MNKAAVLGLAVLALAAASAPAFADHPKAQVEIMPGSGVRGCEEAANGCFSPSEATVSTGGEVVWTNADDKKHAIVSGSIRGADGMFSSGMIDPGAAFSFKFEEAGTYGYFSTLYPWMSGTITVEGGDHADDHGKAEMMGEKMTGDGDGKMADDGMAKGMMGGPECGDGLVPVQRTNGKTACLTPATAEAFVLRNLGMIVG